MQNTKQNRHFKDVLFKYVLKEKADLLELYNAINDSDYCDPEELEYNTLEDAVYLGIKNDVSFIIHNSMNLYEHQSTINPNMPLRGLFYFSSLYKKLVGDSFDIYGKKLVRLPTPQYIVFYNGKDELPDRMVLRLSDAFVVKTDMPNLECVATVLNINPGHNERIVEKCSKLFQYIQFNGKIREYQEQGFSMEDAVDMAVTYCMEHDILKQILTENRSAFMDDILTTYDAEKHMEWIAKENFEEGYEQGEARGEARGVARGIELIAMNMLRANKPLDEIEMLTGISYEDLMKLADKVCESV